MKVIVIIDFFYVNDRMWACNSLFLDITNKHAPIKTKFLKKPSAPFINSALRKAILKRNMLYNKYAKNKTSQNWNAYKKMRNFCVSLRRKSIRHYFQEKCGEEAQNNDFWKTVKPFLSNKNAGSQEPITLLNNNKLISDPVEVAEQLNDYFTNIASQIGTHAPDPNFSPEDNGLERVMISMNNTQVSLP